MECRGKPDTAGNIARSVSRFPSFPRNISCYIYIAESLTCSGLRNWALVTQYL